MPDSDADLQQVFQFIMDELGFGEFKESTRAFFAAQVRQLHARGAEGVILGCTEIELLLRQEDTPEVPLFASAELHIAAAARVAAGLQRVADYEPPTDSPPPADAPPLAPPLAPPPPAAHAASPVPHLDAAAVRRLLPVDVALEAAALALRSLSDGSGTMPVRGARPRPLTPHALGARPLALALALALTLALFSPSSSCSPSPLPPPSPTLALTLSATPCPNPNQVRSVMKLPVEQLGLLASMPSCLGALICSDTGRPVAPRLATLASLGAVVSPGSWLRCALGRSRCAAQGPIGGCAVRQ